MVDHAKLSKGLRESILAVIAGSYSAGELNRLIAVSHALAGSFLSSKSTHHSLRSMYGLTSSDLAFDCIADLFAQDSNGQYVQLHAYFAGLSLMTANDEEILAHLRRLVFSKVNQGIFRLYSEADPSLAKILRNIKLAIQSLKNFEEVERFGEPCIMPGLCDALIEKPAFEREELETRFFQMSDGDELIPELLSKLSLCLREQCERCRILPLVGVGLLFRSVYAKKELPQSDAEIADDLLLTKDAAAIIRKACEDVKLQMKGRYAGSEKVKAELFDLYIRVIQDEVCERFLGNDNSASSLFEGLQHRLPGLTKEEYSRNHRNRVEYLLKLVHRKAVKELKRM